MIENLGQDVVQQLRPRGKTFAPSSGGRFSPMIIFFVLNKHTNVGTY